MPFLQSSRTLDPILPNSQVTLPMTIAESAQLSVLEQNRKIASIFDDPLAIVPATIASMADTFARSLPLIPDDTVDKFLRENFPSLAQTREAHRETFGAIGDVAGLFIPGTLAVRAVRSTGFIGQLATRTLGPGAARYFTSTGLSNKALFEESFQRARILASKGGRRVDTDPVLRNLNRKLLGRSVGDVVIENLAADAAIIASMHQSDFLFPDEIAMVENLIYFGAFNAVFGFAAYAAGRFSLQRGINKAAASVAESAQNPRGLPRSSVRSDVVDNRGPAVSVLAAFAQDIQEQVARGRVSGDEVLEANAVTALNATQAKLAEVFVNLFRDSPIPKVTRAVTIDNQKSPHLNTLRLVSQEQPFAFDGIRSLEPLDSFADTMADRHIRRVVELDADRRVLQKQVDVLSRQTGTRAQREFAKQQNKLQKTTDSLEDLLRTVGVVYEIDGTVSGFSSRAAIFQDGARAIKTFRGGLSETTADSLRIRIDDEGAIDFPKDRIEDLADLENVKRPLMRTADFMKLSHVQKTAVHDLVQKAFEQLEKSGIAKWNGMKLLSSSHHTQFDLAERLVRRFEDAALSKIDGVDSLDDILYGSLNSKFREYQLLRNEAMTETNKGRPHIYDTLDNVANALNLPKDNHKLLEMFEAARVDGQVLPLQAIGKDMDTIRNALRIHVGGQPTDALAPGLRLRGSMHELPRDALPVIGLIRSGESTGAITRSELLQQTVSLRNLVLDRLRDPDNKSLIVSAVVEDMLSRPEALKAAKESVGSVVQTTNYGSFLKQFVTQAFRVRDVDAARPLDVIASTSQLAIEKASEAALKLPSNMLGPAGKPLTHQEVFNRILSRDTRGDLRSFFLARNALGHGWDVKNVVTTQGRGGATQYQFVLNDRSARNQSLWKELFNEEMPEEALMPTASNSRTPATISELAWRAVESMNALSQQLLREYNTLLGAQGKRLIKAKSLHLPARDLTAEHKQFLLDRAGNARVVVGGATERQARELALKEIKNSQIPLIMLDEASMPLYFEARGRAWASMDDYSKPTNQTGPATGKSFGATEQGSAQLFHQMLESILRGYTDVGRSARAMMFDPEIQFLKLQKASAGIPAKERDSIFDLLINRIIGTQNIHAESVPGKLLLATADAYDKVAQRVFDNLTDFRPRFGASEEFAQFSRDLEPQHNPFRDFNDFLEKSENVKLPGEMRKHAGLLNETTTALSIRIADVGMGVINMVSLASTLPPVIKMVNRLPDENAAEHMNRIAAWGAATPNGLGYFSATRAIVSGAHLMFSEEGRRVAKSASSKGMFDQFAAEQVELYGRTGEKFLSGWIRSATSKASIVTDKTERLARAISWMTFYNMGKKGLGLHDDAAMAFAHAQANNVIADFRPSNRPVVFQGAAGMPFGLFTTFMWNFLQRMYSIVETRNMPALVNQVGLHAFFFGAEAVPGVDIALERLGTIYGDGSENLADRLHRSVGPAATDFMLNGAIANMTGVSVGPRAGIGLPGQMGFGLERQAAGIRMMTKLWDTFWREVDVVRENEGIDAGQMAEVIARANVNKGLSHMIELAQGRSLDARGNIIEEFEPLIGGDPIAAVQKDARTRMAYGARALGFKPLLADELRQENRRNRVTDRIRDELTERLAESLKSKIRRGRLRGEDVEQALDHYVRAGGNPENFKRFFTSQVVRGTQNKLDREIADALKTSVDRNRLARLLFLSSQE